MFFSQIVFFDFTCILHSLLIFNRLECVGKVCKEVTYTLYLHTSPKYSSIHGDRIKNIKAEYISNSLYINDLIELNSSIIAFSLFVPHRSTIKLYRSTMMLLHSLNVLRCSIKGSSAIDRLYRVFFYRIHLEGL